MEVLYFFGGAVILMIVLFFMKRGRLAQRREYLIGRHGINRNR